jgi:excisionase family DNA binding protein
MTTETLVRWLPVCVAAKMLNVSRQRVYELVRDGQLGWQRLGKTILISKRSIDERIERRKGQYEL